MLSVWTSSISADISSGYSPPHNPQSIDDMSYVQTFAVTGDTLTQRYSVLQESISPSVHRYNTFWQSYESSALPSSLQPMACPAGYLTVPPTPSGLNANGGLYNRYRCIAAGAVEQMAGYLEMDDMFDFESAAIIWCVPPQYRDPACLGQPTVATQSGPDNFTEAYQIFVQSNNAAQNKSSDTLQLTSQSAQGNTSGVAVAQSAFDASGCSCAPTVDSIDDYADFVTFLIHDLPSDGGYFQHVIVFNEVANAEWFDLSGSMPGSVVVTEEVSPPDVQTWISRYAQLMTVTHASVSAASPTHPVLIYASTDRYWGVPPVFTQWNLNRAHIGSGTVIQGLWDILGLTMDWSLAVHVYGDPLENDFVGGDPPAYTFVTLTDIAAFMQSNYQRVGGTATTAPQLWMAATENGWAKAQYTDDRRAQILCQAYNVTLATPGLLWTSHNEFQSIGGDVYGLVPLEAGDVLQTSSVIFQAYSSTNRDVWVTGNHYCCATWQTGCAT